MQESQLPVNTSEDFVAEFEKMDLSALTDKQFLVAVNTGDPNKGKFLTSTVHGPYDFTEMCQEVGFMWQEHQHHAKIVVLDKNRDSKVKTLDANTTDYIECHYLDIVTESMLEGIFEKPEYTCKANIIEQDANDPENSDNA